MEIRFTSFLQVKDIQAKYHKLLRQAPVFHPVPKNDRSAPFNGAAAGVSICY
jgi:hypothetical protein